MLNSSSSIPAEIETVILTFNEEKNLASCLQSVHGLVRNIFIVDSGSTDKTPEIASRYGAKIFIHPFTTQAEQFNWALENLPLESEWILRLDGDEYLLPELKEEMVRFLPSLSNEITGLYLKRRMIFMGRWIRHGGYYPTWILRLFRRGKARMETADLNEHIVLLEGKSAHLKNDFVDHDHEGLKEWLLKHEGFAHRQARFFMKMRKDYDSNWIKARFFGEQPERKRWLLKNLYQYSPPFFRAFLYFIYRYFFRLGFLDGIPGLVFHFLHGCWYPFYVDCIIFGEKSKISNE